MNWEAIATCAEFVGAIGVIASLLFLGIETRKNTLTMRASLSNEVLNSSAELNDVVLADRELWSLTSKLTDPAKSIEDFDTEEKDGMIYLGRALFMRTEGVYMLYRQGLVESSIWESRRAIAAGLIQLPIWKYYWDNDRSLGVFSKEFVENMENADAIEIRRPISAGRT